MSSQLNLLHVAKKKISKRSTIRHTACHIVFAYLQLQLLTDVGIIIMLPENSVKLHKILK